MRLRPPHADEAELLRAMIGAYHAEDGTPLDAGHVARVVRRLLDGEALARLWLIEAEGTVCGYLCLALGFAIEVGGGDFYVDELYVEPDRRGRGVGTRALEAAERSALTLGAVRVCLEVEAANCDARRLYERRGYAAHRRSLMSKRLEMG
ncbi:MAG: GNAT family N-acetyltransferase [Geminicoccaceae bacterium]|nr:GNAT family N-acetyltransferase [Geminicoccaceae bacterium]